MNKLQCVCKTGPKGNGPRCKKNAVDGYDLCAIHLKKCHIVQAPPHPLTAAQLTRSPPAAPTAGPSASQKSPRRGNSKSKSPVDIRTLHENRVLDKRAHIEYNPFPLVPLHDYVKNRRHVYTYLKRQFINMSSCLKEDAKRSQLVLPVSDLLDIHDIVFEERIGLKSTHGEIYRVYTKNTRREPPIYFMSKVMTTHFKNTNEIDVLNKVSGFAFCEGFINFPLIYTHLRCDSKCSTDKCPKVIKKVDKYYTFFSELANRGDLETFLETTKLTPTELESIILQIVYAVYTFHTRIGFTHNDMRLGNILIHEVKPGGSFAYKIGNRTVEVPNRGYIVILWDFGQATRIEHDISPEDYDNDWDDDVDPVGDYLKPLSLLTLIKPMSENIVEWIYNNIDYFGKNNIATEYDFITKFPFVELKY
jgi:hypothetical protein